MELFVANGVSTFDFSIDVHLPDCDKIKKKKNVRICLNSTKQSNHNSE